MFGWDACCAEAPSLVFESRFESGNLARAIQIGPLEYDLLVTRHHLGLLCVLC